VKILHSVEGGDVEQVCLNLETILPCLRMLIFLSLSLVFYILPAYIFHLFICLIHVCLINYMLGFVCSHLSSTKRVIVAPQLLIWKNLEEMVQSLSPEIRLHSLVILYVLA